MDKIVIELRVPPDGPEDLTIEGLFQRLRRVCQEEERLRQMLRALRRYHEEPDDPMMEPSLEEVLHG